MKMVLLLNNLVKTNAIFLRIIDEQSKKKKVKKNLKVFETKVFTVILSCPC